MLVHSYLPCQPILQVALERPACLIAWCEGFGSMHGLHLYEHLAEVGWHGHQELGMCLASKIQARRR